MRQERLDTKNTIIMDAKAFPVHFLTDDPLTSRMGQQITNVRKHMVGSIAIAGSISLLKDSSFWD
jgi:hypothetical protein